MSATVLTVRPERFVAGGDALGKADDGRVVFVRGALPGELVTVELTEQKRDWSRGDVVAVVEPSAHRVIPPCRFRLAGCGGCDWQHLEATTQLSAKAAILAEAMRRTGGLDGAVIIEGPSAPWRSYRTSVRVVGSPSGRAGFRRERSNTTVHVDVCMVAHPALFDVLRNVRIDPDVELTVRVSEATGQMTAMWDSRQGEVKGLPDTVRTGRSAALYEDVAGHRFRVSAGSFFQSGPAAAGLLVDAVRRASPEIDAAEHVVDAYAGVGLFGLAAVPATSRTTSIETSRSSVGDASVNLAGRAATIVRSEVGAWRPGGERVDVVIADPARSGLGKPGSAALAAAGAPVLVLVSCDPVSLARDAALLRQHGYRHERTEVLDLFPMTHHVEAVTRFVAESGRDRVTTHWHTEGVLQPDVSDEVAAALSDGVAVVALESTIFSNLGLPSPANAEALGRCTRAIRERGAVPALTAVLDGVARVGLDATEYDRILGPARKAAERDLAVAVAKQWAFGATTVSASVALAAAAGIEVFATGGIGGVHRGAELTGDVSADLDALAHHAVITVCAGAKAFLDLARTLEYLETVGVPVLGWRHDWFPAFYTRSSGLRVPHRVDSAAEVVATLHQRTRPSTGVLVAVPIPEADELDPDELDAVLTLAHDDCERAGIVGAAVTPFVLGRIAEATEGRSVPANLALAEHNAAVAAEIAVVAAGR